MKADIHPVFQIRYQQIANAPEKGLTVTRAFHLPVDPGAAQMGHRREGIEYGFSPWRHARIVLAGMIDIKRRIFGKTAMLIDIVQQRFVTV